MEPTNTNSFLGTEEVSLYIPTSDERILAMLSHILTLFSSFLIPLVIWLVKKDDSPYVAAHAKESLNFQITVFICSIGCAILMLVLIGVFLLWLLGIAAFILVIVATIKASENKMYKYPFNFRLIK